MTRVARRLRPRTTLLLVVLAFFLVVVPTVSADSPTISSTVEGIVGSNGWYRGSSGGNFVIVHWTVSGAVISTTGCEPAIKVSGPTKGTSLTCSAQTSDGGAWQTKTIKIDADPPTGVVANASRAPDANGWYNHAVGIGWQGADATSGIAGCSSVTYGGPDNGAAAVGGGCTDNAGNSASTAFGLRYDATAPTVTGLSVDSKDGADVIEWKSSSGDDTAVVSRVPRVGGPERLVFRGAGGRFVDKTIRDGIEYRYAVRTIDQAANESKAVTVVAVPKVVTLGKPTYVPRVAAQPILRMPRVRGATYYHVQLFRRGKRILAAWPRGRELTLRRAWVWSGRRYKLTPGRYRWFAWAGYGSRSAARYKLLGKDDFILTRQD